ncbi:MAG: hypothetical protein WCF23_24525, partial [Candidatus Nitrosopolaris sp.]
VLVDAGNGKVLASTQMSMMAMMQSSLGRGMGMMGPEFMMQHGMMKGPGMVTKDHFLRQQSLFFRF